MCLGGGSPPHKQEAPPPPPPPPADAPAAPVFNEAATNASNSESSIGRARRGRRSLRVDLSANPAATSAPEPSTGGIGLNIPT